MLRIVIDSIGDYVDGLICILPEERQTVAQDC